MPEARKPAEESARLEALQAYDILDTLPEKAYDDIVYMASTICDTPMAIVSFVDNERQWFKSRRGLDAEQTPRSVAFCAHAILEPEALLVVEDATLDERFADNPLVVEQPKIRFYAGAPLVTNQGHALGTLCVLDTQPHQLDETQEEMLRALSRQIMAQLELRRSVSELKHRNRQLKRSRDELADLCRILESQRDVFERDLHRAEVIQQSLLPHHAPDLDNCYVQTLYRPGHTIGGDLYDIVAIDDRQLVIVIADAAGHGVSAAMLSVLFKHHLSRSMQFTGSAHPAALLAALNQSLYLNRPAPGAFVTAVYCLLDTVTEELTIASAGHVPVICVREDGSVETVEHTGPALGLESTAHYEEARLDLQPGDRLLLYTDGLLDTVDPDPPDPHSIASMLKDIGEHPTALEALLERVAGGREHGDRDDVTLLMLVLGEGENRFNETGASVNLSAAAQRAAPEILYAEQDGTTFYFFDGRITWTYGQTLFDRVNAAISAGQDVVLDFTDCTHLDSTLLGTLHELLLGAQDAGRSLRLQRVAPELEAAFRELSMQQLLAHVDDAPQPAPAARETLELTDVSLPRQRDRLLKAHEVLAELSDNNRSEMAALIEALRAEDRR